MTKDKKIQIMGILNVTPDSFSDGGKFKHLDQAFAHAEQMIADGVDIIDIGGESSRPGSDGIGLEEELKRVVPVLERIKKSFSIPVSIDTTKSEVARIAVSDCGADIVNDISAMRGDPKMAGVLAGLKVPVILMHMKGMPKNMQDQPYYNDVVGEISAFLKERCDFAIANGISAERLVIDPGIGFGKRLADNIEIIRNLGQIRELGYPLLMGLSRKRFLGEICGEADPMERTVETALANLVSVMNGANILRVHDVRETRKVIQIYSALN